MQPIEFYAPVIGPKVYIAKGASGWPETFNRRIADQQLAHFIGPLNLDDLVQTFVKQRKITEEAEPTSWAHITHYLARNLNVPLKTIPGEVGIAFWALVVIALQAWAAN